jgi:hypothetical protein
MRLIEWGMPRLSCTVAEDPEHFLSLRMRQVGSFFFVLPQSIEMQ